MDTPSRGEIVSGPIRAPESGIGANQRLTVGRILSRSFSTWGRNLAAFTLLTFVINVPLLAWKIAMAAGYGVDLVHGKAEDVMGRAFLMSGVLILISTVTSTIVSAVVMFGVVEQLRGRRAPFLACVRRGMSSLGRAIATSLLAALAFGAFGVPILMAYLAGSGPRTYGLLSIVLVWPVFWVVCRLAVAVPVAVMEGSGPVQSLRRSWQLTRGRAFTVAAVFLVLGLLSGLSSYVLGKIGVELFGTYGKLGAETLIGAILGALSAVSSAVIYYELRVNLEGTDADELAAIFA